VLDRISARDRVSGKLREMSPAHDQWVVVDEHTIERPFGWIFFYNSERFVTTGNAIYRLAGNGPVFVNKATESIEFFGSTPPLEDLISRYELALGGKPPDSATQ